MNPAIPMIAIDSSQIASIGYDAESKTLAVQFLRGDKPIWHYLEVPPEKFAEFQKSESKGAFLGKHIKPVFKAVKQP